LIVFAKTRMETTASGAVLPVTKDTRMSCAVYDRRQCSEARNRQTLV
jgi:hypothetical protein